MVKSTSRNKSPFKANTQSTSDDTLIIFSVDISPWINEGMSVEL